jgi:hypothetical protein
VPPAKIEGVLQFDPIEIMFEQLIRDAEQLDGFLSGSRHLQDVRGWSRKLLKIALKTAISEVAGRWRLMVYPRLSARWVGGT